MPTKLPESIESLVDPVFSGDAEETTSEPPAIGVKPGKGVVGAGEPGEIVGAVENGEGVSKTELVAFSVTRRLLAESGSPGILVPSQNEVPKTANPAATNSSTCIRDGFVAFSATTLTSEFPAAVVAEARFLQKTSSRPPAIDDAK